MYKNYILIILINIYICKKNFAHITWTHKIEIFICINNTDLHMHRIMLWFLKYIKKENHSAVTKINDFIA